MITVRKHSIKQWAEWELEYLFENINKVPIEQICKRLGRNENSIKLKLHRHRSSAFSVLNDNVLLRIITKKFVGKPELFSPTRSFYQDVKIGQKRFWAIYKGVEKMTNDEIKRITTYFNMPYTEYLDAIQLTIDDAINDNESSDVAINN